LRSKTCEALTKARDSALLAVEVYNKPAIAFRSGGFIVLMIIAWTSLLHAVAYARGRKPWHKAKGRYVREDDNEPRHWELRECLRFYFEDDNPPIRKNLEFFALLRNRIEHRSMPALDAKIFGECQAMVIGFDQLLEREFGSKYKLDHMLPFSLQFGRSRVLDERPPRSSGWKAVSAFIDTYRSALGSDILASNEYSFQVFLLPRIGNHERSADLAVQWVHYDPNKPVEMAEYERIVALIKPKQVGVERSDLMKPKAVAFKVAATLKKPFTMNDHATCWKRYGVRPSQAGPNARTDDRYCVWDGLANAFVYTPAWIEFLVTELADEDTYKATRPQPRLERPSLGL